MMNDRCPGADELTGYVMGTLPTDSAELVADHIETCPACDDTITNLEAADDTVLRRLRQPAPSDPLQEEPACEHAVQVIQAMGRDPSFTSVPAAPEHLGGAESELGSIGGYQLLEKLGEGGMGAVYKALHIKLNKVVAIKVLPAERMKDQQAVARFEREMRAVGALEHPNIVRAMDAGEENGTHFLVMEHVKGLDLSQITKQHGPLPMNAACELIRQAAVGLDEAFDHDIVHRDIKPSNLILAQRRKKPPVVKILDMGLALLSDAHSPDKEGLTTTGQTMGTLDYMAPEQGGDSKNVDIRADIYALGATLYRLLCGQVIYHGEQYQTPVQKMMALATQPVPPIQSRVDGVPDELAAIVHKMLEKNPDARFATPQEIVDALAPFCAGAELSHLLTEAPKELPPAESALSVTELGASSSEVDTDVSASGEPGASAPRNDSPSVDPSAVTIAPAIQFTPAKPQAAAERQVPTSVLIAGGAGLLGIAGLVAAIAFFFQTPHGTLRVEIDDPHIEVTIKGEDIVLTKADKEPIKLKAGEHTLIVTRGDFTFETQQLILKRGEATTVKVELLPGKVQVVSAGNVLGDHVLDGERVRVEDEPVAATVPVAVLGEPSEGIVAHYIAYSPDGTTIASNNGGQAVKLWDVATGRARTTKIEHEGKTNCVAYSPDGRILASTGSQGSVKLCDATTFEELLSFLVEGEDALGAFAFSPDGKTFATAHPKHVKIWDTASGRELLSFNPICGQNVLFLAYSPDGKTIAAAGQSHRMRLWDASTGEERLCVDGKGFNFCITFSPDGKTVATGSAQDTVVRLHDAETGDVRLTLEHDLHLRSFVFSPDGTMLASGGRKGGTRLWDASTGELRRQWGERWAFSVSQLAFAPSGKYLAAARTNGTIAIFRLSDEPRLAPPPAVAPFDADQAKRHQQAWADYLGVPVEKEIVVGKDEEGKDVTLTMVLIPPGEFMMGSTAEEQARFLELARAVGEGSRIGETPSKWVLEKIPTEGPRHRVRITQPFYLGKHEVTQAQWQAVTGDNPSRFSDNPSHPVEMVRWDQLQSFVERLNAGSDSAEMTFAFPTEAQWEYACRAGTETPYPFGESEKDLSEYAWFEGNSDRITRPVGQLEPNGFGLHDMLGNVQEWCSDMFAADYYAESPVNDPPGPSTLDANPAALRRVSRGGSANLHPSLCRSAFRIAFIRTQGHANSHLGFRLAASIDVDKLKADTRASNVDAAAKFIRGNWKIDGDVIEHVERDKMAMLLFGSPDFGDGDFTCEVMRSEGAHGLAIVARASDLQHYYYFDVGVFDNRWSSIYSKEAGSNWRRIDQKQIPPIPTDEWVKLRLRLRGDSIQGYINDQLILDGQDDRRLQGYIGLRTWNEAGKFRNLKFTDPSGKVLWEGLPDLPQSGSESAAGSNGNPDRAAVEWIKSISRPTNYIVIREGSEKQTVKNNTMADFELPKGPFEPTGVCLMYNEHLTEEGFAKLAACRNLTLLKCGYTSVPDAWLAEMGDAVANLEELYLDGPATTDAGLATFKDCEKLTNLALTHVKATSEGLQNFSRCKNLNKLSLGGTLLGDVSLEAFAGCTELEHLDVRNTGMDGAELVHFKDCDHLRHVDLNRVRSLDKTALENLKDCNLQWLNVGETGVTDDALAFLHECKELTYLNIAETNVTDEFVLSLKQSLPDCEISRKRLW